MNQYDQQWCRCGFKRDDHIYKEYCPSPLDMRKKKGDRLRFERSTFFNSGQVAVQPMKPREDDDR